MAILDQPVDFTEAVKILTSKNLMPTDMSSAELRGIPSSIKRQSIFSARNHINDVLQTIKDSVSTFLKPQTDERGVTVGFNKADAREAIRNALKEVGYQAEPGEEGSLKDLKSGGRIDLIVETNARMAQGAGAEIAASASDTRLQNWPAWELIRGADVEVPRGERLEKGTIVEVPDDGWPARFKAAAEDSGDDDAINVLNETGRMMARKDSELWQSLGDGAGGYDDTLGNSYEPYAFNSEMVREEVSRDEAVEAGLIDEDDEIEKPDLDFANLFGTEEST